MYRIWIILGHTHHDGRRSSLPWLLTMILLCLGSGGCTVPLWNDATGKQLYAPVIMGATSTPTRPAESTCLLICYRNQQTPGFEGFAIHLLPRHDFYFLLPIDAQRQPGRPFRYVGALRQWNEIFANPSTQEQTLQQEMLMRISNLDAQALLQSPCFVSAQQMGVWSNGSRLRRGPNLYAYLPPPQWRSGKSNPQTQFDLSYLSRPTESKEEHRRATTNPVLRDEVCVIFLPPTQPRPGLDRAVALGQAALLAPVAIVGDGLLLTTLVIVSIF